MNYCSQCGAEISIMVPANDDRERYVCPSCNTIHYQNPIVVAGCIPVWKDQILLCKRAIEPRYGYWTLPGGFMELGETTTEAALRETQEEASARVEIQNLYVVLNLPHVNQVYMMFRSVLQDLEFGPGAESSDVKLFREKEIPWDALAFRTIRYTLEFYFEDNDRGRFPLHVGDIIKERSDYRFRPGPSDEQV
jgi:ADP-ribose pyrophosphatase YjhB (NUDIX family)